MSVMTLFHSMCPQVLVEKLAWLPAGVFLELLALCQCLPGPSSTQLSFALGITQQGATGGLVSGALCRSWVPPRVLHTPAHSFLWWPRVCVWRLCGLKLSNIDTRTLE
jgi:Chromate transporter